MTPNKTSLPEALNELLKAANQSLDSLKNEAQLKENQELEKRNKFTTDLLAASLLLLPETLRNYASVTNDHHLDIRIPYFAVITHRLEIKEHDGVFEEVKLSTYHYGDDAAKCWKNYQYKATEGEVHLSYRRDLTDYEDLNLALAQAQEIGDNLAQANIDAENQRLEEQKPPAPELLRFCPFIPDLDGGRHPCLKEQCALFNKTQGDCSILLLSFPPLYCND